MTLQHDLASFFTVTNESDYYKLSEILETANQHKEDWQQEGELFVVVKHYRDTPERDEPARMLYAINYEDAYNRSSFLLGNDKAPAFTYALYAVCSLDGWHGSNTGSIQVIDRKPIFVTDYATLALNAFMSSNLPEQTLTVVHKQSGQVQVFYAGLLWAEAQTAEDALAQVGQQIDSYGSKRG